MIAWNRIEVNCITEYTCSTGDFYLISIIVTDAFVPISIRDRGVSLT